MNNVGIVYKIIPTQDFSFLNRNNTFLKENGQSCQNQESYSTHDRNIGKFKIDLMCIILVQ